MCNGVVVLAKTFIPILCDFKPQEVFKIIKFPNLVLVITLLVIVIMISIHYLAFIENIIIMYSNHGKRKKK